MHIALSLGDIARQAGIDTHTPTPSYSHSHSGCVTHAFMHNSMQVNINTYTHMLTHTWHHTAIISPGFKLALKQHAEKRNPNRKIRIEKKSNAPPPQLSEKEWKKIGINAPIQNRVQRHRHCIFNWKRVFRLHFIRRYDTTNTRFSLVLVSHPMNGKSQMVYIFIYHERLPGEKTGCWQCMHIKIFWSLK